ncbi:MAG: formate dehydrogenase accessory protein FdhE [Sulfuriferula sp.]|nr:formate dehydrogenase accessory protein FdhE [Sulfuriferula sp.]
MTAATPIIQPGQIEPPAGAIPYIYITPRDNVFRDRAARLRQLATGHVMQDFLLFMAELTDAQHAALATFPKVPLPTEAELSLCREHGMPPLSVQSWPRNPVWQETLKQIIAHVMPAATPAAGKILMRLQKMDSAALEAFATDILAGQFDDMDLGVAPFIAAALQVYWTHMATTLGAHAFGANDISNLCPVCASPPVSSIVRIGGAENALRYLACSVCNSQWHMVRVKCSNCESTKGISYFMIEGTSGAVKAESCEECGTYLKIMYMDKDPQVDPIADDLATLALDLMLDESGKLRSGPNLLLISTSAIAA